MRWVVGILLVSAAILKAVQLITDPTVTLTNGRLLPSLQVGAELGIGLLALNGAYWRQLVRLLRSLASSSLVDVRLGFSGGARFIGFSAI
jgi:hypothetical protein